MEVNIISEVKEQLPAEALEIMPDQDILRFLKQRHFEVAEALPLILEYVAWYTTPFSDLDIPNKHLTPASMLRYNEEKTHLYDEFELESFLGRDRMNRPIYWERTGRGKDAVVVVDSS